MALRVLFALLASAAFATAHAQVTLSVAPSTIAAGNDVTITWSGMTGPTATDWVGLFVPGAANNNNKAFRYLNNQAAGSLPFSVPGTVGAGNYEMRIFRNNTYVLQATSNPLAVTTSLTVSPTTGVLGGTVTATWTGIASPTSTDWLGLYALGMPDQPYISFRYTNGAAAGNVPFTIPSSLTTGGPFELRLFANNTWTKLAISNSFTANVSIAGTITSGGSALAGAALSATGGGTCTNTNASGQYSCSVPRGWWGSVAPTLAGYSFTSPSRTYSELTANQTAQDYTATQVRQVSGTLTLSGAAFAGVAPAATNGGICSPSNSVGQYTCTVPMNWSGSVTPARNGYIFTPTSRSYSNVTANQAAQDYTAAAPAALSSVYFVHVDHLNTPRLIANSAQQARWRWDQTEPFGDAQPDENPSSLGAFEFPLRFPGQYTDKETNLSYNYFRDCYDPALGRYCQSDPIGLVGGINTYSYVYDNPLDSTDPKGLDTYMCTRPLRFTLGALTYRKTVNLPAVGPVHHQYVCTWNDLTGQTVCGSITPSVSTLAGILGSPSLRTGPNDGDVYDPTRCQLVAAPNDCLETCIVGKLRGDLPTYDVRANIGRGSRGAQECQTFSNSILQSCRQQCGLQ